MRTSAVGPIVGVTLVALLAGCAQNTGPAQLPAGAVTFDVPTFEWGRDGGRDAGVTGHLAFTDEGCTMLYQPGQEDRALPIVFPNATGIRYGNGVRAVIDEHGDLYGVEGQQVGYAGGWVDPNESWTATCGAYDGPEVGMINDEPAHGPLETVPAPPDAAVPTRRPLLRIWVGTRCRRSSGTLPKVATRRCLRAVWNSRTTVVPLSTTTGSAQG